MIGISFISAVSQSVALVPPFLSLHLSWSHYSSIICLSSSANSGSTRVFRSHCSNSRRTYYGQLCRFAPLDATPPPSFLSFCLSSVDILTSHQCWFVSTLPSPSPNSNHSQAFGKTNKWRNSKPSPSSFIQREQPLAFSSLMLAGRRRWILLSWERCMDVWIDDSHLILFPLIMNVPQSQRKIRPQDGFLWPPVPSLTSAMSLFSLNYRLWPIFRSSCSSAFCLLSTLWISPSRSSFSQVETGKTHTTFPRKWRNQIFRK